MGAAKVVHWYGLTEVSTHVANDGLSPHGKKERIEGMHNFLHFHQRYLNLVEPLWMIVPCYIKKNASVMYSIIMLLCLFSVA